MPALPCGLIAAGFNPCAVDLVCNRLMGFDYEKIKMLKYVVDNPQLFGAEVKKIKLHTNSHFKDIFDKGNRNPYLAFTPHPGWEGHIEI